MPLIEVTYPAGTFSSQARTELVDELTTAMLHAERAPDTEFFRTITWVDLHELPAEHMYAAGRPVSEPRFRVQATVPQGALSERRKAELVEEVTKRVLAAAGLSHADALRVWVLINEVPEGHWGAAGNVIRFEQLRQMAAVEREQPGAAVVS
jgi:phenylpyruvate tautomerase PptA (4-oxalocrotonate tautomerase family)